MVNDKISCQRLASSVNLEAICDRLNLTNPVIAYAQFTCLVLIMNLNASDKLNIILIFRYTLGLIARSFSCPNQLGADLQFHYHYHLITSTLPFHCLQVLCYLLSQPLTALFNYSKDNY